MKTWSLALGAAEDRDDDQIITKAELQEYHRVPWSEVGDCSIWVLRDVQEFVQCVEGQMIFPACTEPL